MRTPAEGVRAVNAATRLAWRDAACHESAKPGRRQHSSRFLRTWAPLTSHAQQLDDEFVDRFGIVGPVETALPRFERLARLGLDFCRVVPGSRDATPEVMGASLTTLATIVKGALARAAVSPEPQPC